MHISEFDYELPAELIAQTPLEQRDASRMLVLDRGEQDLDRFKLQKLHQLSSSERCRGREQLARHSRATDRAREETGGQVEIFLVREIETDVWEALVRPGGTVEKRRARSFRRTAS